MTDHDGNPVHSDEAESVACPNRRALLRAGVGGFALAASGLFLPSHEDEAAAREGAYGGTLGGRHGPNRRGRDKRRDRNDKKDKKKRRDDAPKDRGPFRATALTVVNKTVEPIGFTFYYQIKTGLDAYALPTADGERTLAPNESFRYDPDRYRVGALFTQTFVAGHFYVDVRNVSFWFPRGSVGYGETLDPAKGEVGCCWIPEQNFAGGETREHGKIVLKRKDDSAGRIEWELTVNQPG